MSTQDIDKGEAKLRREMRRMDKAYLLIGVFEDAEGYEDGTTVYEVAFWNEYGTPDAKNPIPERSFLRSTIDKNKSEFVDLTERLASMIISGRMTVSKAFDIIGVRIRESIRTTILKLNDPPNSQWTQKEKGFNNPLVDSKRLWRSISYQKVISNGLRIAPKPSNTKGKG